MSDPINVFDRDKFAEALGVVVYEPFKERREQREELCVDLGGRTIGHLVAEGFHFTREEFEWKLKELLAKHR